jgi:hypothetical protein
VLEGDGVRVRVDGEREARTRRRGGRRDADDERGSDAAREDDRERDDERDADDRTTRAVLDGLTLEHADRRRGSVLERSPREPR